MDEQVDERQAETEEQEYQWPLPYGAGAALETVGRFMIAAAIIFGIIALLMFGRVGRYDDWSAPVVVTIIVSALWSAGLAFGVLRLGTALRWLEAIGKKYEITKG